jgi:hypothetical protein
MNILILNFFDAFCMFQTLGFIFRMTVAYIMSMVSISSPVGSTMCSILRPYVEDTKKIKILI